MLTENDRIDAAKLVGPWLVLFPVTYLAHIAEECFGNFPGSIAALTGLNVSMSAFVAANALLWIVMMAAVAFVLLRPSHAWIAITLATIVIVNTGLHVAGSLLLDGYSPGVVSAVLLWLPLGVATLARGKRVLTPQRYCWSIVLGIAIHAVVPGVLLGFNS